MFACLDWSKILIDNKFRMELFYWHGSYVEKSLNDESYKFDYTNNERYGAMG